MVRRIFLGLFALALTFPGAVPAETKMAEKPAHHGGYTIMPDLSIGGADAADESFFYEKYGSIEVDSDGAGNVYVMDSGNVRIQVFDSGGKFLRSLGAEGEGPGEFQIMGRMSVSANGRVAVSDMGQSRISILDSAGTLVRDQIVGVGIEDLYLGDDGTLYVGYDSHGPAAVVAYGAEGNVLWEAQKREGPAGGQVVRIEIGNQTVAPRLAVLSDGRALQTPKGEYQLRCFSNRGDGLVTLRRPFERREITEQEMFPEPQEGEEGGPQVVMIRKEAPGEGLPARTRTSSSKEWEGEGGHPFDPARIRQFMPKHHPDTRGLLVFSDGRIWVVTSHDDGKGMVTDEWSTEGEYLRRFSIPGKYDRLRVGSDGRIYGVTHDEDDYPNALRLQVETEA